MERIVSGKGGQDQGEEGQEYYNGNYINLIVYSPPINYVHNAELGDNISGIESVPVEVVSNSLFCHISKSPSTDERSVQL